MSAGSVDQHPMLLCRDHIPDDMVADLDAWIPKHLADSVADPGVSSAASFAVAWGLPGMLSPPGGRLIGYAAVGMDELVAWLGSDALKAAIEDGSERESQVWEVDGEPFTGNIYAVVEQRGTVAADFVDGGGLYVERYQVDDATAGEFDAWLHSEQVEAVSRWPGVVRVRTWEQNRNVPDAFPYDRYVSKGNRMLSADLAAGVDPHALLRDAAVWMTIARSAQWDLRLPYVRREAGTMLTHCLDA